MVYPCIYMVYLRTYIHGIYVVCNKTFLSSVLDTGLYNNSEPIHSRIDLTFGSRAYWSKGLATMPTHYTPPPKIPPPLLPPLPPPHVFCYGWGTAKTRQ